MFSLRDLVASTLSDASPGARPREAAPRPSMALGDAWRVARVRVVRVEEDTLVGELVDEEGGPPARVPLEELSPSDVVTMDSVFFCVVDARGRASRTDARLVHGLLAATFPAIASGHVRVARIARRPGFVTKVVLAMEKPPDGGERDACAVCLDGLDEPAELLVEALGDEAVDYLAASDELSLACDALAPIDVVRAARDGERIALVVRDRTHVVRRVGALVGARGASTLGGLAAELVGRDLALWDEDSFARFEEGDATARPLLEVSTRTPAGAPLALRDRLALRIRRHVEFVGLDVVELGVEVGEDRALLTGLAATDDARDEAVSIARLHVREVESAIRVE